MSGDTAYALLRFSQYGLLIGLFGITAFRIDGLSQTMGPSGKPIITTGLTVGAAVALIVSAALMMVSIAAMMAQPVAQVEWTTITAIISTTDLGWAFLARTGLLATAFMICLFFVRSSIAYIVAALCFGLTLATLPFSGHAAAGEAAFGLMHRLNDAVHLLAAAYWLGAICWFLCLAVAAHRNRSISTLALLADMHKFAPMGVILVTLVALTGAINAQLIFGIQNGFAVVRTNYGWLLAAKLLLVCVMLFFGACNAWIVRRQPSSDVLSANLARLRFSLGAELTLAVSVIGLMAFIGMMSPMSDGN